MGERGGEDRGSGCQWAAAGSVLLAAAAVSPGSGDTILLPFDQLGCLAQPTLSPCTLSNIMGASGKVAAGGWYLHTSGIGSASLSSSPGVWVELRDRDTALPVDLYMKQPLTQSLSCQRLGF